MPSLVKFYIRHTLIGFAIAAVFVAGLIWQDVMGLGRLMTGSADGLLAAGLLWAFLGTIFGGAQTGIALFLLHEDRDGDDEDDDGPQGGMRVPVRVPVDAGRRRHL